MSKTLIKKILYLIYILIKFLDKMDLTNSLFLEKSHPSRKDNLTSFKDNHILIIVVQEVFSLNFTPDS